MLFRSPVHDHRLVYDHVQAYSNSINAQPMSIMVLGTAGTGKSYLIHCLRHLLGATVTVLAPTGEAAVNIGVPTLHSAFLFPNVNTFAQLRGPSLQKLQETFNGIKYIIIDEVSMIGCNMLNAINMRLQQAFPDSADQVFGGCSVMLFGDFGQLPPVGDSRLFHPNIVNPNAVLGNLAYQTIQRVFFLTQCVRQAYDEGFRDLLLRLRDGVSTVDDYDILSARFQGRADDADFQQAFRLFPTRQSVAEHNVSKLVALDVPIATFESAHNKAQAKTASSDEAGGLERWLSLAVGANIMLRANLWVQKGLVNGTVGAVLHISFKNEGPPALPAVVIYQFPPYTGPSFLPGTAGAFPVTPITLTWQSGHSTFSRTGSPLSLSWALTIHKCQGLTLDKAVVDIGQSWA